MIFVLEGHREPLRLLLFFLGQSVGLHFSFLPLQAPSLLLVSPLGLFVIPARMVLAEKTHTLKSDLVIDTRYA